MDGINWQVLDICFQHPGEKFDIAPFLRKNCKASIEEIQATVDGTISKEQAIQVFSEIGGDMSVFPTSKHLVSWTGCCLRNYQSNQKIKSTRISRAGSYNLLKQRDYVIKDEPLTAS